MKGKPQGTPFLDHSKGRGLTINIDIFALFKGPFHLKLGTQPCFHIRIGGHTCKVSLSVQTKVYTQ